MSDIAFLPISPLATDGLPSAARDRRARSDEPKTVSFGQLVSEQVHERFEARPRQRDEMRTPRPAERSSEDQDEGIHDCMVEPTETVCPAEEVTCHHSDEDRDPAMPRDGGDGTQQDRPSERDHGERCENLSRDDDVALQMTEELRQPAESRHADASSTLDKAIAPASGQTVPATVASARAAMDAGVLPTQTAPGLLMAGPVSAEVATTIIDSKVAAISSVSPAQPVDLSVLVKGAALPAGQAEPSFADPALAASVKGEAAKVELARQTIETAGISLRSEASASSLDAETEAMLASIAPMTGKDQPSGKAKGSLSGEMSSGAVLSLLAGLDADKAVDAPSASGRSLGDIPGFKPAHVPAPLGQRMAAGEGVAKAPQSPDAPKAVFSDWINQFAQTQGVHHRSGDLVGSLDRALAGLPTPNAGQDALRPTPLQMLPIEIGMNAMRGVKSFQIRLDPAELGRVDVQLDIRDDGEVKATLVVDRVETLTMLKRDAHTLQYAFEQAGLRQSSDGLSFSLRGESQPNRDGQNQNDNPGRSSHADDAETRSGDVLPELVMRRVMIPNSSLDLVI